MKQLSANSIKSFCDIIHNEPDQRIKNKLSAWADQYVNNTDYNIDIDFGFLSGIASESSLKNEIESWINNLIGTPSITIPETVVETPNTVVIDVETPIEKEPEVVVSEITPEETKEEPIVEKPKRKRKPL